MTEEPEDDLERPLSVVDFGLLLWCAAAVIGVIVFATDHTARPRVIGAVTFLAWANTFIAQVATRRNKPKPTHE